MVWYAYEFYEIMSLMLYFTYIANPNINKIFNRDIFTSKKYIISH